MPDEKSPSSGAFLLASLMYFCSGQPMHYCCGVDSRAIRYSEVALQQWMKSHQRLSTSEPQ